MKRNQSPGQVTRPPLSEMSLDELRSWTRQTREALWRKMQREQAYLSRRASRGVRTSTDDVLEADLLAMLDERERAVDQQA